MNHIGDFDKVATIGIGKGYRAPEGLWGRLLEKDDVLVEAGRGLSDSELIKAFRASNVVRTYRFKREVTRQSMAVDFPAHLERGSEGQESCGDSPSYLRTIDRQLRSELNGGNSRWGIEDTYGHTRRIQHPCKNGDNRGK